MRKKEAYVKYKNSSILNFKEEGIEGYTDTFVIDEQKMYLSIYSESEYELVRV